MSMGNTEVVMDTNVAIVANGMTDQAGPDCKLECIAHLRRIRGECRVLLDNRNRILAEYGKKLRHSGQPGPGDAFFKWLFDNQSNLNAARKLL